MFAGTSEIRARIDAKYAINYYFMEDIQKLFDLLLAKFLRKFLNVF